jgi:hypothetical protein
MGIRLSEGELSNEEMRGEVTRIIGKFERLKGSPAGIQDQISYFGFWKSVDERIELIKRSDILVDQQTFERFQTWWDLTESRAKMSGLDMKPPRSRRDL